MYFFKSFMFDFIFLVPKILETNKRAFIGISLLILNANLYEFSFVWAKRLGFLIALSKED